jgi:steroid delta-isomerase-like uncharacterized protein
MANTYKELARRYMDDAWSHGNLSILDELVSRDIRLHDPVFPGLVPGIESLRRHIQACRNGFPDLRFTIEDTIAERNEVVIHWTAHGTHRGAFLGMAPTNRSATVSGTSIFRCENDRIVEAWADWNLMTLLEQLGLAAAPKAEIRSKQRGA